MDTLGPLWVAAVHSASLQDPDGAKLVLKKAKGLLPRLQRIWADGIYEHAVAWVREQLSVVLEIVNKRPEAHRFEALPHRWIVERTFGWFSSYRRLSRDYESHLATSEAMLFFAMTNLMVRRLARMGAS